MFEPSDKPRVIGVPPGADFPAVLVQNILAAYASQPPESLARLRILVNTRRMERRLVRLFSDGNARLLPRIRQVTDVNALLPGGQLPLPIGRLRRKLELAQLTTRLIEAEPDLAARASAVDLADSLAALLDEMQGEGVAIEAFRDIDTSDVSLHWARSLKFIDIVTQYLARMPAEGLDDEARRRVAVELLLQRWEVAPPQTPVIVAGSTGSRSTTRMLMRKVACLPQGAVLLPGFDFDLPGQIWERLAETKDAEDHPQFRFARFLDELGLATDQVRRWGTPPDAKRNKLISLSLRPAAVTDQWLGEGPGLGDLPGATHDMSLIEASRSKDEALAIAVALREAIDTGKRAALITPDRTLARRVAATLARWNVLPDDSAGVPLSLTPPGRFLRQVGRMIGRRATPDQLVALLKHPMCRSGADDRGPHLLYTRRLEVFLRNAAVFEVNDAVLDRFSVDAAPELLAWVDWVRGVVGKVTTTTLPRLSDCVAHHIALAELIAEGGSDGAGNLWEKSAGRSCRALLETFLEESDFTGDVSFADYLRLCETGLAADSDREPDLVRPDVMVWGTLEARVQGAELVVLGGLNEGTWPEPPSPDPWLNRQMRRKLGLLSPEQQVGLAAHDYQQAVAARHVILSRAARSDDGEAVPSRWLNRLTNLLEGLPDQGGETALEAMRDRGNRLLALAWGLDRPKQSLEAAKRPAPSPPRKKRPDRLSVTEIRTLIRDPYAIYAKHVLRLRPMDPLLPKPDARLKGIVFHSILEAFFCPTVDLSDKDAARSKLFEIADECLQRHVPWHAIRVHWRGHLAQIADHLIASEQKRRATGECIGAEVRGVIQVADTGVTITGKADRIDRLKTGDLVIYDYKTGTVPSGDQVRYFDRQLLIEAVMAEEGAFDDIPPAPVDSVVHLHLGRTPKDSEIALVDAYETVTVSAELAELLGRYNSESTGYISRRAMEKMRYEGDYDHLARFGEWDASASTKPRPVK